MIICVDDERSITEMLEQILSDENRMVKCFHSANEALAFMENQPPDMIISDVMMPEMDGFTFQEEYRRRYPQRNTPFLFLSSLSDPDSVVRGLNSGAEDFITKPIHPVILKAKVKNVLHKTRQQFKSTFSGTLKELNFVKLLQFCETKGLNGEVEITTPEMTVRLNFEAGNMIEDPQNQELDTLTHLYDATEGSFTIRVRPFSFDSIAYSSIGQSGAAERPILTFPPGKLSGIKVGDKTIQIQSEFIQLPEPQMLTIAVLNGRVLMKKASPLVEEAEQSQLAKWLADQHAEMEQQVKDKLHQWEYTNLREQQQAVTQLNSLFDKGLEAYYAGNYEEAHQCWQQAAKLDPQHKLVQNNLKIVRGKLGLDAW